MIPVKSDEPEFGEAVKEKEPEPVPLAPALMVSQFELETADQTQLFCVLTETV
jgi:hypothetical protein